MKRKIRTKLLCLVMLLILLVSLTGCKEKKSEVSGSLPSDKDTSDTTEEYPITISHAFGETVLEAEPVRIVTLGWGNQDTPLALGVVPVGVSAANYGLVTEHQLHVWTEEAFQALGETAPNVFNDVDGFDYEAISDAKPDVILAAYSGMTEEEYALLSEIAPTIPYSKAAWQTNWRDQTLENAAGMGRKADGEAKVAEVEAFIKEKLAEYPELAGVNTGFFWISADNFSTFYAYLPADPRCAFLEDLGLNIPQSILDMAASEEEFSVTLSRENVEALQDIDLMIVYGDEALLEALQADELMSVIPAIKNGAVVLLDSTSAMAAATTPSVLSIPAELEEYLKLLHQAYTGNAK